MILTQIKNGSNVRIIQFQGGKGIEYKLRQFGLVKGDCVRVIRQAPIGGPVLIEIRGRIVALGRGIANKIEVEEDICD